MDAVWLVIIITSLIVSVWALSVGIGELTQKGKRIEGGKKQALERQEILRNSIKVEEISPEIIAVKYLMKPPYSFIIRNWRKVKKDKIYYFDKGEIMFDFFILGHGNISLTSVNRSCLQWNFTAIDEYLPDNMLGKTLCLIYIGDGAIEALEDEIEMKKIEEGLRKKERKKELEKLVKQRLNNEDYNL